MDVKYGVMVTDGGNEYMIAAQDKEDAIFTAKTEYNRLGKNLSKKAMLEVVSYDFDAAVEEHAEMRGLELDEAREEALEWMKSSDFCPIESVIETFEFIDEEE